MRQWLLNRLREALESAHKQGELQTPPENLSIPLEIPREAQRGDYATPLALALASRERRPPRDVAGTLVRHLADPEGYLDRVEVAGPGFINFAFHPRFWQQGLRQALLAGESYGNGHLGDGIRVQVEFVSANPTGPLHVGHGRGAALGDSLARLLEAAGYQVHREYYINDVGRQMTLLGESTWARYLELLGESVAFPEEGYQGAYIREIARKALEQEGPRLREWPREEAVAWFSRFAREEILTTIRKDLEDFGVTFDQWFSEQSLYDRGEVEACLRFLEERGYLYEREGARWVATTSFGDTKDRVVVRSNGQTTYFASDIAYHRNKIQRGFQMLINIWGADHHGYEPRIRAALQALGFSPEALKIILVQLVTLVRGGKPVSMSTRAGEFVTLREVLDEVGRDAARFLFLTRRADSPLEFDLELAKQQSQENPVYYVQYAHARIASLFRQARERGIPQPVLEETDLSPLCLPEEIRLMKRVCAYPEWVEESARALEPHRLTFFLQDLAADLHQYYYRHRILTEDLPLTQARLLLMQAVGQVLRHALGILGVEAPERM